MIDMNGYYDKEGSHRCSKNHLTQYQMFSGGEEFYCPFCDLQGVYPPGGNLRAQLLTKGDKGIKELRKQMNRELEKRKREL